MDTADYIDALFADKRANVTKRIVRTASTRLLPPNRQRTGFIIHNTTTVPIYMRFGDDEASLNEYTTVIEARSAFTLMQSVAKMPKMEVQAVLPPVTAADLVSVPADYTVNKWDEDLTNAMLRGAIGEQGTVSAEFSVTDQAVQGALKVLGATSVSGSGGSINADVLYGSLEAMHQIDQITAGTTSSTITFDLEGGTLDIGSEVEGTGVTFQAIVMVTEFTTDFSYLPS